MLPPDSEKGFSFKKPAGSASTESLSTIQKVIRYAEKDDLLLYITAAFGIFMPAAVYFFYRYIHNRFRRNKKKKFKTNQPPVENERKTVIFYFPGGTIGKQFAYKLADALQRFDPLVAKINAKELDKARWPKTVHIFVVSDEDIEEEKRAQFAEFVDWLDEIRYEHRKRNYLRDVRFCSLYLTRNSSTSGETAAENDESVLEEALEKRLRSLGATSLYRNIVRTNDNSRSEERKELEKICAHLDGLLCRFYYGEFDGPELNANVSAAEYSASEESD